MDAIPDGAGARELRRVLAGARPPRRLERWRFELPAGAMATTTPGDWEGAIILVETGEVRVECAGGGSCTFVAGDVLALGWVAVRRLANPGLRPARLVVTRRRVPPAPHDPP